MIDGALRMAGFFVALPGLLLIALADALEEQGRRRRYYREAVKHPESMLD